MSNQKGGREGRTTRTQKSLLYTITYVQQKTLCQSLNGWRPGPTDSRRCTFTSPICRRLRIQYVFLHMCGVNHVLDYCLLHSCKTSKQHSLWHWTNTETRSSLRRHKLGLTDQSIRSNDDKTRFTCVHRLMMTGHSQNICRKVPDDVVLQIWQFKVDCSFIFKSFVRSYVCSMKVLYQFW